MHLKILNKSTMIKHRNLEMQNNSFLNWWMFQSKLNNHIHPDLFAFIHQKHICIIRIRYIFISWQAVDRNCESFQLYCVLFYSTLMYYAKDFAIKCMTCRICNPLRGNKHLLHLSHYIHKTMISTLNLFHATSLTLTQNKTMCVVKYEIQ